MARSLIAARAMTDAALVSPSGSPLLTYGELEDWSSELASRLAPHAEPGAVMVCVLPNSVAFVVALVAAWKAEIAFAPLSSRAPAAELRRVLDRLQPQILVGGPCGLGAPTVACRVSWDDAGRPSPVAVEPARRCREPDGGPGPIPEPRDGLVLFTSGSTGTPKGVLLTRGNVEAGTAAVRCRYGLSPADRTVAILPWTHGHGLIGVLLSSLSAGASVVVDAASSGRPALATAAEAQEVTWISVVPPLLADLLDRATGGARACRGRWRFIRTASAPLAPRLATRAEEVFQCPVAEAYGMTETAHQAAANPPALDRRVPGSVGVPTGVRFRTTGPDLGEGQELEVSGPAVFRGYLRNPGATDAALRDGWYRTHDVGTIDGAERIRLLGRSSEFINRGGSKVSPCEVESVLAEHPGIAASIVAGVPDGRLGEEIGVLVRPAEGSEITVCGVLDFCRAQLAPYKVPRLVLLVSDIPTLPNGKPSRREAAKLIHLARTI